MRGIRKSVKNVGRVEMMDEEVECEEEMERRIVYYVWLRRRRN